VWTGVKKVSSDASKNITLTVPRELKERAKKQGINVSALCRYALVDVLERLENKKPKRGAV